MADVMTLFATVWMLLYTPPAPPEPSGYPSFSYSVHFCEAGDNGCIEKVEFSRSETASYFAELGDPLETVPAKGWIIVCLRDMGPYLNPYGDPLADADFVRLRKSLQEHPRWVEVWAENGSTSCLREIDRQLAGQFDGQLYYQLYSEQFEWVE